MSVIRFCRRTECPASRDLTTAWFGISLGRSRTEVSFAVAGRSAADECLQRRVDNASQVLPRAVKSEPPGYLDIKASATYAAAERSSHMYSTVDLSGPVLNVAVYARGGLEKQFLLPLDGVSWNRSPR